MNLDKRLQNLEQRVGPTERVDRIILVGVERAEGGELVEVSRSVLWATDDGNGTDKAGDSK